MIYHVVAMAGNRVIGKDNHLPWHFSSDLKHFKKLTTGQTVLMGRKTYESIGKPLPQRDNFVLSRTPPHPHPNPLPPSATKMADPSSGGKGGEEKVRGEDRIRFFPSIDSALQNVRTTHCFIIGGAEVFRLTLALIDGIYLTLINADYEGDAFYPELPKNFAEQSREKLQEEPKIEVIFYERQA